MATQYGPWKVIRSLDEGGQAHVFLVEDTTGKYPGQYVLKRLKNRGRLDLFEREVNAMAALDRPHVLRVVMSDLGGVSPYYVAEYCERGSLADQPEQFYGDIGGTVNVLTAIADALQSAHVAHVIHRDVKPGNILFRGDGTPVLGDFGICHMDGDQRVTVADEAMGSRNYIAPEMESGRRFGDPTDRTDVYALGKVAYWMLSGGREFAREDHRSEGLYLPRLLGDQRWEHVHALLAGCGKRLLGVGRRNSDSRKHWEFQEVGHSREASGTWNHEFFSILLDETVVEDPQKRLTISAMVKRLDQTASLIMGDYPPLRPSMGLRCRFCRIGIYAQYASKEDRPQQAAWFGAVGNFAGSDLRVLRCDHCGHVEWFDVTGIRAAKWWQK